MEYTLSFVVVLTFIFILFYSLYCASCRQSLCGTSYQQTTSTQTLLSDGELAWKTSCCVLHHILSFPMTKSSSSFWQRLAPKLAPENVLFKCPIHVCRTYADMHTLAVLQEFKITTSCKHRQNNARSCTGGSIQRRRKYERAYWKLLLPWLTLPKWKIWKIILCILLPLDKPWTELPDLCFIFSKYPVTTCSIQRSHLRSFVVVQLSAGKPYFYTVWLIILSIICQSSVLRRRDGGRRFWRQVSRTRYTVSCALSPSHFSWIVHCLNCFTSIHPVPPTE